MDIISEFLTRYRREYDFYEQACRIAAQILDSNLRAAGIRSIVTSRAKNPVRLEDKVRQRAQKAGYSSVEDIYADIVDLSGVRVALYFPGEREEVGKIIREFFILKKNKEFPASSAPPQGKRFSGYWATHYHVQLPEKPLNESQSRYTDVTIEIQVASVLMHAWSEVEHDLAYKPLQGKLSEDEYAILDELNGLVLAGEIALERLQRAGEFRTSTAGRKYENHYDLATSLLELVRENLSDINANGATMGRTDLLFQLLAATDLDTPDNLKRYVKALHSDFQKRPLSEQIIDQILLEDSSRYDAFVQIRMANSPLEFRVTGDPSRRAQNEGIGVFMSLWIEFEKTLRTKAGVGGIIASAMPAYRHLNKLDLPKGTLDIAERLRRFRNSLVHGPYLQSSEEIEAAISELKALQQVILTYPDPSPK